MSANKKKNEKNLSLLIIAVLLLSVFVICIEVVTVNNSNKKREEQLSKSAHENTFEPITTGDSIYDTSNLAFTQLDLNVNQTLESICEEGCNLKIKDSNLMFIIKKNKETLEYRLDLVKDQTSIFENKQLGTSLAGASIINYANYKALKMKIKNLDYYYDYALFIDETSLAFDEIASLNANEMEFLENGVIYYYDVCSSDSKVPSKKVKAVRAPFSDKPAIISSTPATFSWCN